MAGLAGSDVQVIYDDDVDVTAHSLITRARFTSSALAQVGECELELRDMDRELTFVSGRRLKLLIDGQQMWSGFVMIPGKSSFFPAGDGVEDTKARRHILRGADNNRLLDFRKLRRPADYLSAIPNITTDTFDGDLLKTALQDYFDMPSWLDIDTFIDNVAIPTGTTITAAEPWAWPQQGSSLRQLLQDLAAWSAAVYYIGPDDAVHYHAIQDVENAWGFSDRPNKAPITGSGGFEGAYWGFRELEADEDGSGIITDAFVWGGSPFAGSGSTVFHRATDESLEGVYGKWQLAETHFNETNFKTQKTVDQRAHMIVYGSPTHDLNLTAPGSVVGEGPRGLRFPQWQYTFAWHTKDVPSIAGVSSHLYPGNIVPIQLWAYSEDEGATPLTKFLPLRQLGISFPSGAKEGKAHVRFSGLFDLRNEDSKFLWKYLRRREPTVSNIILPVVDDSSTSASLGASGRFIPTPLPNDVQTVFTIPFGYIPGTSMFYKNGLALRVNDPDGNGYSETDNEAGTFTLDVAPATGDKLYVTCRTLAG
jgi:hypothetical protein